MEGGSLTVKTMKTKRDFYIRDEDERDMLIAEVWCHRCQDFNRGLDEPQEFEGNGMIFLEGKCAHCTSTVVMEIAESKV